MIKIFSVSIIASAMLAAIGAANAGEYSCMVNCVGPNGTATVTVRASSSSEAAAIVDKQSDKICQSAGYRASTPQTMSSSQCR